MFGKTVEGDMVVKRLHDDDEDDSGSGPSTKIQKINRPTDLLHEVCALLFFYMYKLLLASFVLSYYITKQNPRIDEALS